VGYDVSPNMIAVANRRREERVVPNIEFVNADIENGIDLPENSVSLAIMNMGTASDVKDIKRVLECLRRILHPTGKFFLSFYNSESLLTKIGFVPWPMTLVAYIDADRRCLAVHYADNIYFLYARPRSIKEIENIFIDFEIDNIFTYPTFASILPHIITEHCDEIGNHQPNEEVRKFIKKIDNELASSPLNCGTYIIVTGGKIAR
jgi:SAM-dependent methyltransferase